MVDNQRSASGDLADGEGVILNLRRHWTLLAAELMLSALPLILVINIILTVGERLTPCGSFLVIILSLGLSFLWVVFLWLRWFAVSLTLTERNVVLGRGVFTRVTTVIGLETLQAITCRQSVLGRLLGYGILELQILGSFSQERFGPVPHPYRVRRQMLSAKSLLFNLGRDTMEEHR